MSRRMATTPVHEVMTASPVTVRPGLGLLELIALFDRHDFNAFPVVSDQGALLGLVTKLDVLRALRPDAALRIPDSDTLATVRVTDLMRRGILSVEAEDPVAAAADLLVETRLHSLPVVRRRGGAPILVGMVSRSDLLRGLRFELLEPAKSH